MTAHQDHPDSALDRRQLLAGGAALATATLLSGGALAKQAPELEALAREGKLPPLAERLPKNPLVLQPIERVGRYGGTWRSFVIGSGDRPALIKTVGYEHLVRWSPDWKSVLPNLAESWEALEAGRRYRFKLREGVRWSDGTPFTSEDVAFFITDVLGVPELRVLPPPYLSAGNQRPNAEIRGPYELDITFAEPNGMFIPLMAHAVSEELTKCPAAYAKRFHIKHNPQANELAKQANLASWTDLFRQRVVDRDARWRFVDMPTLHPWVQTIAYDGSGDRLVFRRNPFYWKVDTAGNQLPYIDEVHFQILKDRQVAILKTISGEADFQSRRLEEPKDRPVIVENQRRGRYVLHERVPEFMNTAVFFLNLTSKDARKRALFNRKEFRVAISHALNRTEMVDALFVGQGEPWQAAPRPDSKFFDQGLAKQFTEHDPAKANALLDAMGFTRRDGGGTRLDAEGQPVSFLVELVNGQGYEDIAEMMRRYLRVVGVDFQYKTIERTLYEKKRVGNELEASLWFGDGGIAADIDPRWYMPHSLESAFGVPWAQWRLDRSRGEEPPAAAKTQIALYDDLLREIDEAKRDAIMKRILGIAREEFWCMGISLLPPQVGVTNVRMRNTPKSYIGSWPYPDPAPTNPPQYFFES
jgi:peptide/nickel transport system substrate-binding protein